MSCQQHAIQKRYLSPHMANVIPRLHANLGIRLFTTFSEPRSQAPPSFLLLAVFARGESLGTRLVVCDLEKGGRGRTEKRRCRNRKQKRQAAGEKGREGREEKEGKEKGKRKRQRDLEEGKKQVDEEKEGKGDR